MTDVTDDTVVNKCNSSNVVNFYNVAARSDTSNSLDHRREARIVYMRNFNNWLKSVLISTSLDELWSSKQPFEVSKIRVLDLCCGKGGDQQKWLVGKVSHVTFVDISSDSIEVCKQRYNQLRRRNFYTYSADFIVWDCTKAFPDDLTKSGPFDLVSCQFAIHYAFENLLQARTMLANIANCLRPNGLFIATFPNAYELVRRARLAFSAAAAGRPTASQQSDDSPEGTRGGSSRHPSEGIRFGNLVYSIHFPASSYTLSPPTVCDGERPAAASRQQVPPLVTVSFPLFGARYNFHLDGVVDCPEFLVYPPLLVALAREVGLTTKRVCDDSHRHPTTTSFPDFCHNQLHLSRQHRTLLARMNALEGVENPRCCRHDDDDHEHRHHRGATSWLTKFDREAYLHVERRLDEDESCRHSRFLGTLSQLEWEVISLYSVVSLRKSV